MKPLDSRHPMEFGAPWGRFVKLATGLVGLIVLGMLFAPLAAEWVAPGKARWVWLIPVGGVLIFGITSLFAVRGYRLTPRELWIQRLVWWTRLPLKDLTGAEPDPGAFQKTLRKAGNGGYLAITGWFWSRRLGHFRAFVTDTQRSVVLRFKDRVVVISPDDPEAFVRALGVSSSRKRRS
jgi:hypothetical protein